jgi:hypothetical protein
MIDGNELTYGGVRTERGMGSEGWGGRVVVEPVREQYEEEGILYGMR